MNSSILDNLTNEQINNAFLEMYSSVSVANVTKNHCKFLKASWTLVKNARDISTCTELNEAVSRVIHPDDEMVLKMFDNQTIIEYFETGKTSFTTELRLKNAGGDYNWIKMDIIRINNSIPDDNDLYILSLLTMIDEEKRIEFSFRDATIAAQAANLSKSDFLARVSHDIRTPMNAIIGMTNIVKENIDNKEKALDGLSKVELSSQYLMSLINNILDLTRIESGKMVIERTPFDLVEFVNEIRVLIESQAKLKDIRFNVSLQNISSRYLIGDTLRLKQIFINLLSNSLKFNNKNGTVNFFVEQKQLYENWLNVVFVVSDTGIGISEEALVDIYEPFVRLNKMARTYEGAGLGLSIVHNLTLLMNGIINVKSEPGKGTEFLVEIPLEVDTTVNRVNQPKFEKSPYQEFWEELSGKNILLAEDDMINAEIAYTILEAGKMNVTIAETGIEAVDKFMISPEYFYDAILMDIQMPLMDGFAASKTIRALHRDDSKNIPIVAMTANAFIEDIAAAKANGMDEHLPKPIDISMLYSTIARLINNRGS